jgi:hypothetical protein
MKAPGTLRIHDLEFDLETCEVVAFESEGRLQWGVEAVAVERMLLDDDWRPRATCDVAFSTGKGRRPWAACFPKVARPKDPRRRTSDPAAMLKVFEHEGIRKNILTFGAATGDSIPLTWTGRCDVFFDETYDEDLEFELRGTATFTGILNGGASEQDGRASLSALLDHSELQYVVDEFGASKFVPRASTPRRRARR